MTETTTTTTTTTQAAEASLALTVDRASEALGPVGFAPLAASMARFRAAQAGARRRAAAALAEVRAGIKEVLGDLTGCSLAVVAELEVGPALALPAPVAARITPALPA